MIFSVIRSTKFYTQQEDHTQGERHTCSSTINVIFISASVIYMLSIEFFLSNQLWIQDIKSSNVLITNRLQVKLADFGLARSTVASDGRDFKAEFTNNVVTIWYKCPELLLGSQAYSFPVDVWSAGCECSVYYIVNSR